MTDPHRSTKEAGVPTYRMVYGDQDQVVRETYKDVNIEREDGWTVLFRGRNAILRVRDEHVQSLELVDESEPDQGE
jgi:hypothetical protein